MGSTTIGISDYWDTWLESIVASGIRHSKAQIVSEALGRYREKIEREMEEWKQFKEEKKRE